MSSKKKNKDLHPCLVVADDSGNIYDEPDLLMLVRRGEQWGLPRPDELMPLPKESELFLLPGRKAVGYNPETGEAEEVDGLAVAAFAAPGYTLSGHPVYETEEDARMLPLFAYGAVGFAEDRFWICARRVDMDPRQQFSHIRKGLIEKNVRQLLETYPDNRLVAHILTNCVMRYDCPAARNFSLGRYEAPLPSSRTCNARCIGCISSQEQDSPIEVTPQCRLTFTPTPEELVQVMEIHAARETKRPIFSFGQGCEGDPLMNPELLCAAVRLYRERGGAGTVNCNTNASRPEAVEALAKAGLSAMRVSLNSAREELYTRYYRPHGYSFADVRRSIAVGRENGLFICLNLLYFPGITDTEEELRALSDLVGSCGVSMIQWRNLNIDPEYYLELMQDFAHGPSMGLRSFMKRLKKACPWLQYGYFNPYVGAKAEVPAPMPGTWCPPRVEDALQDAPEATEADGENEPGESGGHDEQGDHGQQEGQQNGQQDGQQQGQ